MTLLCEGRPGGNPGRLFPFRLWNKTGSPLHLAASLLLLLALAGCGGGSSSASGGGGGSGGGTGTSFGGTVSHGAQAVSGASVQLYAAGSDGNGSAANALLSSAVATDANGKFTIPTDYTCPSSSSLLYLVASGGNPGLASGTNNAALALMTAVGACSSLTRGESFAINEVTTVASVWPLAPFMSAGAGAKLGVSGTNTAGLANAFATVGNLAAIKVGIAPGPNLPAGATAPTAALNSLANILSSCVGSNGASGECNSLFSAATPSGGIQPTNTLDAALLIAQNQAKNASALFALTPASPPFQPALTNAPGDWMLSISYTGGGLSEPSALAIDSTGNVWAADYCIITGSVCSNPAPPAPLAAVSKLSPVGQPISPSSGYTGGGMDQIFGLAIDNNDNAWVTNSIGGTSNHNAGGVTELNSSGQILSGSTGYSAGGVNFPYAAASDPSGNIWIANYGNGTATLLSNSGAPLSGSNGYGAGHLVFPTGVAVDASNNAWFANSGGNGVTEISFDGTQVTQIATGSGPAALAIDRHGNVWVANYSSDSVTELSSSGAVVASGYTGGGLDRPGSIAIDGTGNIWVVNHLGDSITELQGADGASPGAAISPAGGFGSGAGLALPFAAAIDGSGSLWVSNSNSDAVVQFVGVAAPVKTPLLGPVRQP
jgi:hypothetical protein